MQDAIDFKSIQQFLLPNCNLCLKVTANYTLLAFKMCCVYGWSKEIKCKESAIESRSAVESPFGAVIFHQFNKRKSWLKKLLANVQ